MKVKATITNEATYNAKVIDVDTEELSGTGYGGGFTGNLEIEVEGAGPREYDGEHGAHDYEAEFGFILEIED